jgi:hypothetical protein
MVRMPEALRRPISLAAEMASQPRTKTQMVVMYEASTLGPAAHVSSAHDVLRDGHRPAAWRLADGCTGRRT